jgi:hypothetical protein
MGPEHCGRGSVVEHHLAKVRVAGSNPVARSEKKRSSGAPFRGPLRASRDENGASGRE